MYRVEVREYLLGSILGDPGADKGDVGKSKRAEKYGTKKSKERREKPLGTMSYQTSSKRSPPFWLLIGARKTKVLGEKKFAVIFICGILFLRIAGKIAKISCNALSNFRCPGVEGV